MKEKLEVELACLSFVVVRKEKTEKRTKNVNTTKHLIDDADSHSFAVSVSLCSNGKPEPCLSQFRCYSLKGKLEVELARLGFVVVRREKIETTKNVNTPKHRVDDSDSQ